MESIEKTRIPKHLIPLFEASNETGVIQEARELLRFSLPEEQINLLKDVSFLSIVNQALLGMDEQRRESLLDLLNEFAVPIRADAFRIFSRLLNETLP